MEGDRGMLRGIDVGDFFRRIVLEHGLALVFVSPDAPFDGFVPGIVPAVVFECPFTEASFEFLAVRAGEMEDMEDINIALHDLGLLHVPGDPVEDEEVDIRLEEVAFGTAVDICLPELDGEFIGDEFAPAGVMDKLLAERGAGIEGPEDIAAGAVHEARNAAQDGTLSAFAAAWSPKHEEGFVAGGFRVARWGRLHLRDSGSIARAGGVGFLPFPLRKETAIFFHSMITPRHLVIATHNAHKTGEFRALLEPEWTVEDLSAFPHLPVPEETGVTFEENATIKALAAAEALGPGVLVVADDSGLEVDALEGRPGVYSARYAGAGAGDRENLQKVLDELAGAGVQGQARRGRFHCVLVAARGPEKLAAFHGAVEGVLADEARGSGGFGYDPAFIPDGFGETFGELPGEVKNRLSHRARALAGLMAWLGGGN